MTTLNKTIAQKTMPPPFNHNILFKFFKKTRHPAKS